MIIEIVHSAIARKMLCNPVNSLIADTELVCASGMILRESGISREEAEQIAKTSDTEELQKKMMTLFSRQDLTKLTEPVQNLAEMIKEYRGIKAPFSKEYQNLFWYGFEKPVKYPKMNL